jgi:hypothetical protein
MKTMGDSPVAEIFWTAPWIFPTIKGERYSVIVGECKSSLQEFSSRGAPTASGDQAAIQ